jgi:type VII secretion-associated serine protease mycosin
MFISSARRGRRESVASAVLGLLLVGVTGVPAHADSTRQQQWFLDAMKAERMWRTSTGEGVTVAVIDSGVDENNPDLKGRILPGKDFATDRAGDERTDYDGHGTGMAGLIAGIGAYDSGNGAFGLAPGAKILPIRMPDAEAAASEGEAARQFNEAAPKAIRYVADSGARVINISLGQTEGSAKLTAAVRYALEKGSLIFAAVGNSGDKGNQVEYPAATPGVVGVAAVGKNLSRTAESEHGPQVDLAAPGEDLVYACASQSGLCSGHGTSGATALASASAALIWSRHPTWTNNQILRVLLNTIGAPTDGAKRNDSIGYGIVRPRVALQSPGDPGPAGEYPLPDLAAAQASGAPGSQASASGVAGVPAKGDDLPAAFSSARHSGGSVRWLRLGVSAAVLVGGSVVVLVARRRRQT